MGPPAYQKCLTEWSSCQDGLAELRGSGFCAEALSSASPLLVITARLGTSEGEVLQASLVFELDTLPSVVL